MERNSNSNINNNYYNNIEQMLTQELKIIKKIKSHSHSIKNISIFPSGNLVSVSSDQSIIIYNDQFEIIQKIENAHDSIIWDVQIKDKDNFATCSTDSSIKFWTKNIRENIFILKEIIGNANNIISKILYTKKGNLISSSIEGIIKIWQEVKDKHQYITKLYHQGIVKSLLLCEDKNILISSGYKKTRFWDLRNYECLQIIDDRGAYYGNSMKRINDDIIILAGSLCFDLSLISLNEQKIIKREVYIKLDIHSVGVDKEKGYIFFEQEGGKIIVYNIDNHEFISSFRIDNNTDINGIERLNDGRIISWDSNGQIYIWNYIN